MPEYRGLLTDLRPEELRPFARAIYRILQDSRAAAARLRDSSGRGIAAPRAYQRALYPYSNVAGTLNLPSMLPQNVAALRKALARAS